MSTDEPPNTDGTDPDAPTPEDERAEATVNRNTDGDPLGSSLFLSVEDLVALGIDPDRTREVTYWIEDGELRVAAVASGGSDE